MFSTEQLKRMRQSEAEMRKCFDALDADGSGKITCRELETLFKNMGDNDESAKWNAMVGVVNYYVYLYIETISNISL